MPKLTIWETILQNNPEVDDLIKDKNGKLTSAIVKLIRDRNLKCTVDSITTHSFDTANKASACLRIYLSIIDDKGDTNKIEVRLFFDTLLPPRKCWNLDKNANIPHMSQSLSDYARILLRILWILYTTIVEYQDSSHAYVVLSDTHKGVVWLCSDSGGLSTSATYGAQ